ncbi:hypothetical protein QFZ89_008098 [Paraburkholderia youngii]|uniref:Transposase n=1 Tax=Paraburkholderia youngii TaxID=2782701 RepID=A0ABX2NX72_9BURK|nr:hypothetical protein [Paraburkholderia youngii]NVI09110.1 hypothetical protein [Paraburkholderia youngii]
MDHSTEHRWALKLLAALEKSFRSAKGFKDVRCALSSTVCLETAISNIRRREWKKCATPGTADPAPLEQSYSHAAPATFWLDGTLVNLLTGFCHRATYRPKWQRANHRSSVSSTTAAPDAPC